MTKQLFDARSELRIGRIIEVSGNSVRIELDPRITELTRAVDGRIYPVGQIGSIIKIHFGRKVLFAYVRMLRMRSDVIAEEGTAFSISPNDDTRILEADLFGQGVWDIKISALSFTRGVETYPLPLQSAFLCLSEELENIYRAAEFRASESGINPMVPIGHYIGGNKAVCRANIDKLFGHHCAVLGSTGSGKSGTVASILHSVLNHKSNDKQMNPRIIIIDPHGEYASAFGDKAKVFRAYNGTNEEGRVEQLKLPYWLMSSEEFRSLVIGKTEFEATSQANMVYQAIAYARMVHLGFVKNIGENPVGGARDNIPEEGITEEQVVKFDRDKPIPFSLSEFIKHLDKIQGQKPGRSENLAASSGRDKIDAILKKLKILRSNPQLSFIMEEFSVDPTERLENILSQFVGKSDDKDLRIIDISGLPNEVAGPLTALIARLLFQYKLWQKKEERKVDPVLFVC